MLSYWGVILIKAGNLLKTKGVSLSSNTPLMVFYFLKHITESFISFFYSLVGKLSLVSVTSAVSITSAVSSLEISSAVIFFPFR